MQKGQDKHLKLNMKLAKALHKLFVKSLTEMWLENGGSTCQINNRFNSALKTSSTLIKVSLNLEILECGQGDRMLSSNQSNQFHSTLGVWPFCVEWTSVDAAIAPQGSL